MTNVIKFDPRRKRPEPDKSAKPAKPSRPAGQGVWTVERLAWPIFFFVVVLVIIVTNSGLLAASS